MTTGSARVKFSFSEGLLEVEGSESFVSVQLEKLEPILEKYLNQASIPQAKASTGNPSAKPSTNENSLSEYENLFAINDGRVQILKSIPGSGKAQKSVNVALLLAFANQLQGATGVSYSTIREVCGLHACLDSNNFSKAMKEQKEYFIISGSGNAQTLALTVPGKRKAAELASSLR